MNYAKVHDWNIICEVCRKKIKASEALKRWDGLIVCSEDYEERHPLDYPQPPYRDNDPLPFTRPETTDVFLGVCTVTGRFGIAGYGVTGCAIAGLSPTAIPISTVLTGSFNESTL